MTLATWALRRIRAELPHEPIFDGPRGAYTFDGVAVPKDAPRVIVVHVVAPTHTGVTLGVTSDRAAARIIVHSFATTRTEVEARQAAVIRALKNQQPDDDGYEWSIVEHPESFRADPEPALPAAQFHTIDVFTVGGFEL